MAEIRKKYDAEFRAGAVRIVRETGKPVTQVARDLGINEGTLATWTSREKEATRAGLDPDERAELARLRKENHEPASTPQRCLPCPKPVGAARAAGSDCSAVPCAWT